MTDEPTDKVVAEWPESDRETFERRLREADPLNGSNKGQNEQALEALLVDYQTASEDARYRDRLITQTFYLTFVVGGLLLNGIITLLFQSSVGPVTQSLWLAVISLISLISFGILLVFVESFQQSRESAWARRSEIESYVRSKYPGTLGTNESISRSLSFASSDEDEGSTHDSVESWFAARSVSDVMRYFVLGLLVITLLLFVISIYRFSWAGGWPF